MKLAPIRLGPQHIMPAGGTESIACFEPGDRRNEPFGPERPEGLTERPNFENGLFSPSGQNV